MSVLGEAGGFGVQVGEWPFHDPERTRNMPPAVLVNAPHSGFQGMTPSEARALAALLVTAADEAERGKRLPPTPPIGSPAPPGQFTVDYTYLPNPGRGTSINGLLIPPGAADIVTVGGKARALDADGKIIASNVPGDPGVEPEKGGV